MPNWINVSQSPFKVRFMTNSFKRNLYQLISKEKAQSIEAMDKAMIQFKSDCLEKVPKCPVRSGDLRLAHVIAKSRKTKTGVIGTLRVESPYAATLHEGISRWGTPYKYHTVDTGSHWILSKLLMFGQTYINIIADGTLSSDSPSHPG